MNMEAVMFRNVGNYLPFGVLSNTRRLESSVNTAVRIFIS